jgi:hypothetical protein
MTDRQTNNAGEVAITYYQQVQKFVEAHGSQYVFVVRGNISLAWVKPEDVDAILGILGGCCGQRKPGVFRLSNDSDARRWTNNGGF